MENFSIYKYMKLGIIHFKAYPEATTGEGPIVETLRKLVEDDFWTAIEVGWMKDPKVRHEARKRPRRFWSTPCARYAGTPTSRVRWRST